jgi:GrpB-like predicted nucleotidyltransferase (UPF0157 family)
MTADNQDGEIGEYEYINYTDPTDAFRPYDPRCPEVARRVIALIGERFPEGRVEHVGSTAIPGCDGKGVVDLMLVYSAGRLAAARDAVDALGFQRQRPKPTAFPEERPVRVGSIVHDGETFRLHVHVIAADSPEVAEQLHFRDTLRSDPRLVAEYVAGKRAVLAAGVADSTEYNDGKDAFIKRVLSPES